MTVVLSPHKHPLKLLESTYFMLLHKTEMVLSHDGSTQFSQIQENDPDSRTPFALQWSQVTGIAVQVRNVSVHDSFILHSPLLKPTFFLLVPSVSGQFGFYFHVLYS